MGTRNTSRRAVLSGFAIALAACTTLQTREPQVAGDAGPPPATIDHPQDMPVAAHAAPEPSPGDALSTASFEVAPHGPVSVPTGRPPQSSPLVYDSQGRLMFQGHGVPAEVVDGQALYENATPEVTITSWEIPSPKKRGTRPPIPYDPGLHPPEADGGAGRTLQTAQPQIIGSISPVFDAITFDNDATASGFYHIPPDSHAAAGPNHIVVVTNTSLQVYNKSGAQQGSTVSLQNFFSTAPNPPTTGTFDPKVLYDHFAQRWLVVTLEKVNSPQSSYIFLAVSNTSDPTGSWTRTRITSLETISGTVSWLDYPGFGYDEEAVYITGNMFSFPGSFQATRLFIVPKGLGTGGLYDGGLTTAVRHDPYAGGGAAATTMPARIIGAPPTGTAGTWMTLYSSLSGGGNEFMQVVRITNPLGTPTFSISQLSMGNISDNLAFPDAPQSGTANTIETNDSRALDAVWQNGNLWTVFTYVPNTGTNSGQPSARYVRFSAPAGATPSIAETGDIGGEDIATGAYTFFPAISVNDRGASVIGFSAADESIFPGAYAVSRRATDGSGVISAAQTLRAGTDHYRRTFGGGSNRWGDYSGVATDPANQCFWIYNQYAMTRGTVFGGEDGRWATAFGRACVCQGDEVADTDLDGICDNLDNCDSNANFGQQNADGDAFGDACDACPGNSTVGCTAPSADVSITKSNGVTGLTPGASTTYTITVSNPSANAISSVTVSDSFPANLTGCTWTCTASGTGSCPVAFGSGNISQAVVLAAGGTATFSATCTVFSTASGSVVNTATVSYANDPNSANNSATDTDGLGPAADLSITKTDGATSINAGANVTYTIVATNPATSAVSNVGVADTFPASLSSCTWTCSASAGGSCQSASGSGNISTTTNSIAANNGTLTFSATCTLSTSATGSLANTATVSYANDGNSANNTATDTDTIVPRADVSITKTDGVTSINAGANVTYTIVATNPATVAISNVGVADTFPASLSACTWTCSASAGGSCQSASGSGNISTTTNSIAASNGTLTFTATCTLSASATGSLANTATVTYANDNVAGNNSATDTDTILPPLADLSITKTDGATSINAGANVTYTIVATNPSANTVSNVGVADTFPASLSSCTWTCSASAGGSCQSASGSGNISTTTNSIAASNGTLSFIATCTLSASATGSLANTATVSYSQDNNAANNSATDTDTIVPRADVSITKTDGVTSINAGANVTYTIVATNPATVAISNVGVADTFPASLSACTWTCSASAGGSCQSASGSGNISTTTNSIGASNGTLTLSATCTLSATATGSLANTATVSYANDNVAGNNSATDTDTIVPRADLSITKTDGQTSVNAGANLTYTIVATNPAAVAVSNVGVADTFPVGLTGCTWTCSASAGGSCQAPSGSGNISTTTNTIAASNGTLTFSATCTVLAAATGSLANTATVSYANDNVAANNSATDTDTIVPRADLSITKTDSQTTVNAGSNLTYTITVSNPAATTISNVAVVDGFPASLTACTWTCAASGAGSCQSASGSGDISTNGNSIAAGGTLTFSATCTVLASASGPLANTATLNYANDNNAANNSATDNTTVLPPLADLSITKTDGASSANAGGNVTYTIVATNPSANTVSGVGITDAFPASLSGCTWTCSASAGGSCQAASGSGNIGTASNSIAGNNGTLTYSATCTLSASATGTLANTATVSYSQDNNAANNSATDTDTIVPRADLSITKTDGVTSVNAGAGVTYTIVATNPATVAISNVGVADTFPASLSCTWNCSASTGGTCQSASGSGNIATTTNSIAASNGTLTFTAFCTVSAAATGSLVNTATVSYANDNVAANNSATDTDTIVPRADLSITKTDGVTSVNAGANLTYTIVATNPATVAISNVSVIDAFPAALTACTWTCAASAGGTCQSASGSGNISTANNTLAANNGTLTFSATCTVSPTASGTLENEATVNYANDNNAANDRGTDTDTIVPRADLSITKTNGVSSVVPGSNLSYTIVVTNPAAAAVSGVAVADTFVAALTGCTWTCSASSGGTCQSASGSGNIATTTNSIAANSGTLTFNATCTLSAGATGSVSNTATVGYANDPTAGNDSATDTDTIVGENLFANGFE